MIRCTHDSDICHITIDRPDKAGALTRDMLVTLAEMAHSAQAAKLFILSGTGRVFSAGADLDEAHAGLATDPVWEQASGAIAALPCMTIAALNGTVAGGAFGIMLACDLRLSVPTAKFFYPVMKLGFLPQPSDPARLTRLVGPARAKMILMAGQKIDAQTALQWGLVDQITPPEDLLATACDLGANALAAFPEHIAAIKNMTVST